MYSNEKILKEILKDNYYKNFYNYMNEKNKNELNKILKNTIKVNILLENELLKNDLNNLKDYDLNYLFLKSNFKSILILKYLIMKKF